MMKERIASMGELYQPSHASETWVWNERWRIQEVATSYWKMNQGRQMDCESTEIYVEQIWYNV